MNIHKMVDEVLMLAESKENKRRIAKRRALLARQPDGYVPSVYVRLNRPYQPGRIEMKSTDHIQDPEA